ncbi:hypothetical protein [Kineococcus rhizosphaerae]|uniref:PAS domain-containing protein n=1 Tax=Kineococcus rhizosphaerae TaxID=559628 RepID=A0A2T0R9Q1_9ACTN|nr:hypothetical protein [Kineococcus rhizosphaerae]PRY17883.1 hypothetical protein CLV37_101125 [Kineococcus rhizosphaerae]
MGDALSREHQLRYRAERVRAALEALWGDELPDAPDPVLTVLVDAVAVDDQHGLDDRLVVQGDGLGYEALARVLADVRSTSTLQLLPPALRARLAGALPSAARLIDLRVAGEAALPGEATGAWEYDATEETVAWDARSGVLCGLEQRAGVAPLAEWLRRSVHAEDRALVAGALRSSASTGLPCDVRFRTAAAHPGAVLARGRALTGPGGGVRVLGFAADDVVAV